MGTATTWNLEKAQVNNNASDPSSNPAAGKAWVYVTLDLLKFEIEAGTIRTVVTLDQTQTLTNKTLTAPTIADFTNMAHDHLDADDGGALSAAAITSGQLALARGGTNADLSATGSATHFLRQASSGAAEDRKSSVTVTISENSDVFLDKIRMTAQDLKKELLRLKQENPDLKVFINGDERADFGGAVQVLDDIRSLGIKKVSIQTKRKP